MAYKVKNLRTGKCIGLFSELMVKIPQVFETREEAEAAKKENEHFALMDRKRVQYTIIEV